MKNVDEIAFDAKTAIKLMTKFGAIIDAASDATGISKKRIAKDAGIHPTSLSRIISGEIGVKRETAIALVQSINKLANREVVNEQAALEAAGFASNRIELPDFLYRIDFAAFDPDELKFIEKFIRFLIIDKQRTLIIPINPDQLFSQEDEEKLLGKRKAG